MALDFTKLSTGLASGKQIDPRKIFTTLKRDVRFKRPSDEQADVLDAWFEKRNRANNTLKMNTGSGKTVVGLLCLQSSLNEVGSRLFISVLTSISFDKSSPRPPLSKSRTEDEKDSAFLSGNAILVINVWKLVNGRSVFGVGLKGAKIEIGSLVVDDAHACLVTVADQFTVRLSVTIPLMVHCWHSLKKI